MIYGWQEVLQQHHVTINNRTLTLCSTSIKLVYYPPFATCWLIPSVTGWTVIMCAGDLSWHLSSYLWQEYIVSDYVAFFGVATVNFFFTVNKMMLTSLGEYFSATASNGCSLHSAPQHGNFWA